MIIQQPFNDKYKVLFSQILKSALYIVSINNSDLATERLNAVVNNK